LVASNLALVIIDAMTCKDWEVANELVTRSMEGVFERWVLLLNMVFYRDKGESESGIEDVAGVFLTIAEDSHRRLVRLLHGTPAGHDHDP
jgi:hypothetical protein